MNEYKAAWQQYWQSGALASFLASNPQNPVRRFWADKVAAIKESESVLDIATGNGDLIRFVAGQVATEDLTAIDYAEIDPECMSLNPSIHFLGNTLAEQLPFKEGQFNWVVSQYGIEYSDLTKSLPEACRVLAPKGNLVIVCHSSESLLITQAMSQLEEASLIRQSELFSRLEQNLSLIKSRSSASQQVLQDLASRTQWLKQQQKLDESQSIIPSAISALRQFFDQLQQESVEQITQRISFANAALRANVARLEHQCLAALTKDKLQTITASLQALSLDVDVSRITTSEGELGVAIHAVKGKSK